MTKFEKWAADAADFGVETMKWGGLDSRRFYTSAGAGWEETCDNAHGGRDVSWAFRLRREEVKEKAPAKFLELLKADIQQGIDEKFDEQQWQSVLKWFD
jgi:hypothetical protein